MAVKKKWMDGRLPFLIGYVPSDLRKEIVKSNSSKKLAHYEITTDEKLICDTQVSPGLYYFGGGVIIMGLFFSIIDYENFILKMSPFLAIGIFFFVLAYFIPKKEIVFNRGHSLITYPDWFFMKPHTVPFNELKIFWSSTGGVSGAVGQRLVTAPPNSSRAIELTLHPGLYDHSWSLIVWYMDKNRPLPPGSAFDEYREIDFERRKAEGFPPPLFPSRFPIPEATPEQQAERNRYWRDEDYFGSSDTAWY